MLTFQQIQNGDQVPALAQDSMGFPAVFEYLRRRGIESSELDDLGIQILPAAELMTRARGVQTYDERLAVVFPHFNPQGDYIDWWSARLVDTGIRPAQVSFASLAPAKRGKMFCPPNEPPHAYLVPTLDWKKLQKGDRVYIHESCIKAINGAKCDTWSIGLNGVWGWGSKKHGMALCPELKGLPWKALELQPIIVFDSNAADNWDVQNAIAHLAAKLLEVTGRHAGHLLLPASPDNVHWGFDDFCVHHGTEHAAAWLAGDATPVEIGGVELLKLQLNSEVAVVRSLSRIAEQATGTLMSRASFTDVNYAHYTAVVEERDTERVVSVPKLWLMDPRRTVVEKLTYEPGGERLTESGDLNIWRSMGLEPSRGDVSLWLGLIERNVPQELRGWLLQWFAYPLQNLGAKLTTFVHLFGPPGSGKQAVLAPLMRIYGENSIIIGKDQIGSTFNSVFAYKQFINLDELHGGSAGDAITIANRLKKLVTDDKMVVNTKGQPEYTVPNRAQIVTTANYSDSVRLDDDDRRAAVIRFGERGVGYDKDYWTSYFAWVAGPGAAAVYDYLLGVDLTGFNPQGWAPMTEDKVEVTRATRRVDEQWVNMLYEDPDQVLTPVVRGRALFTTRELAQFCFGDDPGGVTPGKSNSLGIKLHSAGFPKVELKIDGRKDRFWIVRDRQKSWDAAKARAHLAAQAYPGAKKG